MVSDLCKVNLRDLLNNNKKCMGIVFNTDPHNASGQHWFSIYIDLVGKNIKTNQLIYYFDSVADETSTRRNLILFRNYKVNIKKTKQN